jgi:hypothetical protein
MSAVANEESTDDFSGLGIPDLGQLQKRNNPEAIIYHVGKKKRYATCQLVLC